MSGSNDPIDPREYLRKIGLELPDPEVKPFTVREDHETRTERDILREISHIRDDVIEINLAVHKISRTLDRFWSVLVTVLLFSFLIGFPFLLTFVSAHVTNCFR
jgi:hypothetical protein